MPAGYVGAVGDKLKEVTAIAKGEGDTKWKNSVIGE